MPSTTYSLTRTRQLIDLNGDVKNFSLSFSVVSKDGGDFDALVVDQTTLDNTAKLDYKKTVNGTIGGEIRSDKDVYQNYYLILKSDEKRDVDVNIEITEIEPLPRDEPAQQQPPSVVQDDIALENVPVPKTSSINWKLILIVIIVIGGGFLLYKFYMSKNSSPNDKKISSFKPVAPINSLSSPAPPAPSPTPVSAHVPSTPPVSVPVPSPAPVSTPVALDTVSTSPPITASVSSTPKKQGSPIVIPSTSTDSIKSFGFTESKINKGLLDRLNNIKLK
jgi:hypothetical protein